MLGLVMSMELVNALQVRVGVVYPNVACLIIFPGHAAV